jgi:3-phytase
MSLLGGSAALAQSGQVTARVETDPVPNRGDAADDPAIWIHPTNPSQSLIIGTDKDGGLEVYDLAGNKLQVIPISTGNVDLRYNFPLGGQKVALVTGYNKSNDGLFAFKVNPQTRRLENVLPAGRVKVKGGGTAMYHSPVSGKFYLFQSGGGELAQYELFDNGQGLVAVREVRVVSFGTTGKSEGVVADDGLARVYVSEETEAIWRFHAEPNGGTAGVQVDKPISEGGHFQPDMEGLAIYHKSDGRGYLIASSQGNNTYTVYERECDNRYLGNFRIVTGSEIDGVSDTDGIEVTNVPLGSAFPQGLFVAQDGSNSLPNANQNFKLVPWEAIARAFSPALAIDVTWNPRQVGTQGRSAEAEDNSVEPSAQHSVHLPLVIKGQAGC